jgi:RNA polymerase sigma-70 factor (ECF subfamily)
VSEQPAAVEDPDLGLLALYDAALPHVYGYLVSRCGRAPLAEELTAETFLAAVDALRRDRRPRDQRSRDERPPMSTAWLIGVARNKLADHWRRQARDERGFRAVAADEPEHDDPWDVHLEALRARATLDKLAPHHRAALTLRYLDDLPVPDVAALLDRTVHATEGLLVRARGAFRRAYTGEEAGHA